MLYEDDDEEEDFQTPLIKTSLLLLLRVYSSIQAEENYIKDSDFSFLLSQNCP